MNELDRKQFSSFALAQLTVANSVYEFMDCPLFFFCPTGVSTSHLGHSNQNENSEYCESCAIPNLDFSNYLSLLGAKLNPDIHILWTGLVALISTRLPVYYYE
jgi:protein O-GlcNAcase / histone acetyltransferase